MAAGASYAAGEQTSSLVRKCITNPYLQSATHVALCAACLGLSYTGSSSLINEALFSTVQAIGLQALIATSANLFAQKQAMENTAPSNSWFSLSQETKDGIKEGAINALSTILPALCIPNYCDSNVMLRILLYEQAYRLAQCGCFAAQQLIQK